MIGIVFAWILGIGVLLITLLATGPHGGNGVAATNTLFGSIFELGSGAGARRRADRPGGERSPSWSRSGRCCSRRSTPSSPCSRGVRVRVARARAFLVALAVVTAESTQAVGALLLLGLIAAPAGAAHRLTGRPYAGLALSAAIAVAAVWGGIALSYAIPSLPPSSAIIALAAGAYAVVAVLTRAPRGRVRSSGGPDGSRYPARRRGPQFAGHGVVPQRRGALRRSHIGCRAA